MNLYKISYLHDGRNAAQYIRAKSEDEALHIWRDNLLPYYEYEFISVELDKE